MEPRLGRAGVSCRPTTVGQVELADAADVMMMRSSMRRATGKEVMYVFGNDPTSLAGDSMRGHEKEWCGLITSLATVWPNVKQFNTPWKTQPDFFALGSREVPQGVPLASRVVGKGLPYPSPDFGAEGSLLWNAEFLRDGRSQEVLISNPQVLCICEVSLNPFGFPDYPSRTGFQENDRSAFPLKKS